MTWAAASRPSPWRRTPAAQPRLQLSTNGGVDGLVAVSAVVEAVVILCLATLVVAWIGAVAERHAQQRGPRRRRG